MQIETETLEELVREYYLSRIRRVSDDDNDYDDAGNTRHDYYRFGMARVLEEAGVVLPRKICSEIGYRADELRRMIDALAEITSRADQDNAPIMAEFLRDRLDCSGWHTGVGADDPIDAVDFDAIIDGRYRDSPNSREYLSRFYEHGIDALFDRVLWDQYLDYFDKRRAQMGLNQGG